jgi:hypothetical protein
VIVKEHPGGVEFAAESFKRVAFLELVCQTLSRHEVQLAPMGPPKLGNDRSQQNAW